MDRLSDYLNKEQKEKLRAINETILSFRGNSPVGNTKSLNSGFDNPIVHSLETWLLDEEQQEFLQKNSWDIYFLCAASSIFSYIADMNTAEAVPIDQASEKSETAQLSPSPIPILKALKNTNNDAHTDVIENIYHWYHSLDKRNITNSPQALFNSTPINTQFIAASIRLAAELDLESDSVLRDLQSLMLHPEIMDERAVSQQFSIQSKGAHPHFQATILVQITCHNADVHRALKRYESRLQQRLYEINRLVRPRFLYTSIRFEITPVGYQPIDFKFSVDTSSALQLFMGNTLYKDRRVFLRELVQNSVDACNLRKMNDESYQPFISVEFNEDISKITVRDNGIGMSKQWIEKYFLNIGMSFYQSDEILRINRDANIQFSFISQFGIGFLSSFLVAQKVTIKTRKAGSKSLIITVTDIDDYFDVRFADEDYPIGTQVIITLKENTLRYCRSLEYLGYLKTNVRFLPIPVHFVNENGESSILGQEPMSYDEEPLWGTKFTTQLDYKTSQGYLMLRVKENHQYIHDIDASHGGMSIFQDGIFITQVDYLLPENARGNVIGRLNLIGDEKCELSMDRNRLMWPKDQLNQTKKRVMYGLVDIVNQVLQTVSQQPSPDNIEQNITLKLAAFFTINNVDDTVYERLDQKISSRIDDKFRTFIRINHSQFELRKSQPADMLNSHGYIYQWQQRIINRIKEKVAVKNCN